VFATSIARRCRWYLRALGRNPLIRATDRFEALIVLTLLTTALVAIPVAAHAADQTYAARMQTVTEQAHSRHSVEAIVVEGSTTLPVDFDNPAFVRAQWREGTELRTEQIVSPVTVKAGEPLQIWLDEAGSVVAEPLRAFDAKVTAVAAGWIVWLSVALGCALAAVVIRSGLDRYRARAWERQLLLMAHNDDGWANRRT